MLKLDLRIVTPDKLIYEGKATNINALGVEGSFSVLPRHAPMIATLARGEIKIENKDEKEDNTFYVMIDSGVLEVSEDKVNIIAQTAMMAEEAHAAQMKMEFEKHQRKEHNIKAREKMLESELKLRRLINKVSNLDSR
jgi:F-type H+-transporting ATPase subunit epsilon